MSGLYRVRFRESGVYWSSFIGVKDGVVIDCPPLYKKWVGIPLDDLARDLRAMYGDSFSLVECKPDEKIAN